MSQRADLCNFTLHGDMLFTLKGLFPIDTLFVSEKHKKHINQTSAKSPLGVLSTLASLSTLVAVVSFD